MRLEDRALRASLWAAALAALSLLGYTSVRLSEGAYVYVRPWCTVAAAVWLLVGAGAGLRGRTWGVLATSVAATAFVGAAAVGIAPVWFIAAAAVGFAPIIAASRRLFGFDARAAAVAIALALAAGTVAALLAGPVLDLVG